MRAKLELASGPLGCSGQDGLLSRCQGQHTLGSNTTFEIEGAIHKLDHSTGADAGASDTWELLESCQHRAGGSVHAGTRDLEQTSPDSSATSKLQSSCCILPKRKVDAGKNKQCVEKRVKSSNCRAEMTSCLSS